MIAREPYHRASFRALQATEKFPPAPENFRLRRCMRGRDPDSWRWTGSPPVGCPPWHHAGRSGAVTKGAPSHDS
jgi:hypothetical protein